MWSSIAFWTGTVAIAVSITYLFRRYRRREVSPLSPLMETNYRQAYLEARAEIRLHKRMLKEMQQPIIRVDYSALKPVRGVTVYIRQRGGSDFRYRNCGFTTDLDHALRYMEAHRDAHASTRPVWLDEASGEYLSGRSIEPLKKLPQTWPNNAEQH